MGHTVHHAIIATTFDSDYAGQLLSFCRALGVSAVVVPSAVNVYRTIFIGPDGSKSGWADSDKGDRIRAAIKREIAVFNYDDGSNPFEWVEVSYSSDDRNAMVTDSQWPNAQTRRPAGTDPQTTIPHGAGSGALPCSTASEIQK
jgi:hypothetical protein